MYNSARKFPPVTGKVAPKPLPETPPEPKEVTSLKIVQLYPEPIDKQITKKRKGAPYGNEYWKLRRRSGPRPKYSKPYKLRRAIYKAIEWHCANPIVLLAYGTYRGKAYEYEIKKPRCMTISGMCLFIGITERTWRNWRTTREDLWDIMDDAESWMFDRKYMYALINEINPHVVIAEIVAKSKVDQFDKRHREIVRDAIKYEMRDC